MKYLISIIAALALVGCEQSPTALEPTSSPTAPYQAFPIASDGFRLIPGGQTMWDTAFHVEVVNGRWFHRPYDTAREVAVKIDSLYVDTKWGVSSNPTYSQFTTVFEAVLAANEKSKRNGFDTVYSYSGKDSDTLVGLFSRQANGYRIPTPREAKYLLWAGSVSTRPWGSGNINSTWASAHLFGDSATGVRNDFGVYVHFPIPSARELFESIGSATGFEDGAIVSWIYPPDIGLNKKAKNRVPYPGGAIGVAPVVFVRSLR